MMWPSASPADVIGQTRITFGQYSGVTFADFLASKDYNYVPRFLARDINSGQDLRRWLWQCFSVLRDDGFEHLIVKPHGDVIYKKIHAPEGGFNEP